MTSRRRSSKSLDHAQRRIAALKSISPNLDLGNSLTMEAYRSSMNQVSDYLEAYNTMLSAVDAARSKLSQAEKDLSDLSEHMLLGVASKYGKSSEEYEMAGGVRKGERRRPVRKAKAAVTA
ncbi:hypothetical protein [Leptolyngbya sp. FACHB-261]|uniref:hypothetical protein n=1 Tax=Leptolyngbya sp. FACHB-261 TaxID=2692806 RepID=UPI001689B869|nr:hypothetical protein [Leptolyngbya sp. FACHB-261]MBD2104336.1 hypothetical protein [Leptolyngbya sp. FACHB-261]